MPGRPSKHPNEHANEPLRFGRQRIAWYAAIALMFVLIALSSIEMNGRQAVLQGRQRADYQRRLDAFAHVAAADAAALQHASKTLALILLTSPPATRVDAEQLLNGGRWLGPIPPYTYRDPSTGGEALLEFHDELWTAIHPRTRQPPQAPPLPSVRGYEVVMMVRRLAYFIGYLAALRILLIRVITGRRRDRNWRILHSYDLLIVSAAAGALAMLGPQFFDARWNFFQDDSGAWGFVGVGAVGILMITAVLPSWPPWRRRRRNKFACRSCGYNLMGNESGICPECGKQVPRGLLWHSQPTRRSV